MGKNRKTTLKTDYDVIVTRLEKEGKVSRFPAAEILNGVQEEMEDCDRQHIINQFQSEQEAATIILD